MRQSDHEYEERSFGDIQRAIDFENSMNDLESQLYYRRLSPKEVAQQVLKATCQFYDADWCGLIQVDLNLNLWTPFWWFNTGATDKTLILTEEYESAEFLDRWVQAVRKGIPMIVPDAEATKEAYPAEYNLYQRLGIRSVIAVSLEPRPVALLAVRNPKRYIQQTSMLRILAYVLLASYNEQKMLNRLQMVNISTSIQNSKDIYVSLFGELSISTSKGVLKEADFNSPRISRLISYLLISRKNAISPQEITQTLWPDDSDNPAKNVKGLVYRLRQKFSIISDEPLVLSSTSGYQLNPELHIMTDYQRFDELVGGTAGFLHIQMEVSQLESTLKFQRGDIYFVRLDSSTGSEQNGTRPAVILQNDVGNTHSPTLIVATLTSKTEKKAAQPTHCLVEPEKLEPSIVQAEQIFTIDKSRVQNFVGHLTPEEMSRVDDAVKISLALNPMGSIQKLKPIIRSAAAYAPPEVVDGKPPVYPYTPIKSDFEDAETVEEMMLYTELQSAVHAMIQRLEYSFTFNPSLLTSPKRKKQVAEILTEAEKYIWRIKEEMRCA